MKRVRTRVLTDHAVDRCIERNIDRDMCLLARTYGLRLPCRNRFLLRYDLIPDNILDKMPRERRAKLEKILPICCVWELHPEFNDEACITAWRVFENTKNRYHRLNWKRGKASSNKHGNHKLMNMLLREIKERQNA